MTSHIHSKLRDLRIENQVKSIVIADHLGIDESTYNKMETGRANTWGKYFIPILEYYQLSPDDFFASIKNGLATAELKNTVTEDSKTEPILYADKKIVKSLLNEKDKCIRLLEEKIETLESKLSNF